MRILFVALPSNIHTLRWISQLTDQGWDIHLAPSTPHGLHPDLQGKVTFHDTGKFDLLTALRSFSLQESLIWLLRRWPHARGSGHARRLVEWLQPKTPEIHASLGVKLASVIRKIRPDIVHSLVIPASGYQTMAARKVIGDEFPTWIAGIWGSDLYFWGELAAHKERITEVLATCDYITCDCERDALLVRKFGFKGHILPVLSAAGGFDLERWQQFRQPGPTSSRRLIVLKGYQQLVGRALVGLRAIELCADILQDYSIIIPLAALEVSMAAELVANRTGLSIQSVPQTLHTDYEEVMRRYGQARIYIGLSIVDGAPQTMLEAMVMGAFPIQSCTACADEWFEDGKGGLLVPPEDPHIIAEAIRRAITDDALVDQAAQINLETVRQRLAYNHVKEKVVDMYKSVYMSTKDRKIQTL